MSETIFVPFPKSRDGIFNPPAKDYINWGEKYVGQLQTLKKEINDDPEKYHSEFVLKWMNDDAMTCLSAFIEDILKLF